MIMRKKNFPIFKELFMRKLGITIIAMIVKYNTNLVHIILSVNALFKIVPNRKNCRYQHLDIFVFENHNIYSAIIVKGRVNGLIIPTEAISPNVISSK